MEQHAVLNPQNGEYTRFDTADEALTGAMQFALDLYMCHTHQQPITMVTKNEDETETWRTLEGVDITKEILQLLSLKELTSAQIFPVSRV